MVPTVKALTIGLFLVVLADCSGTRADDGKPASPACRTEACRLATKDSRNLARPSDAVVSGYQIALDALGDNCDESEEELGDLAIAVQEELSTKGIEESVFNILTDVNSRMPGGHFDDCGRAFAVYVIHRLGP